MAPFSHRGPLPPGSKLFFGRQKEIELICEACQGPLNHYIIIFGGHQSGRTSLIMRLQAELSKRMVLSCWISFRSIASATVDQAFNYIGDEVIEVLNLPADYPRPTKFGFARWFNNLRINQRLVLFFDELGTLMPETRQHLANELRDTFQRRLKPQSYALNDLMVVLVGGDELFDLVCTEVSTLINVCDEIYLPDLSVDEVICLVGVLLDDRSLTTSDPNKWGRDIYEYTCGQPFLTQVIGEHLVEQVKQGVAYSPELVEQIAGDTLKKDPSRFFYLLCKSIEEQGLLPVAEILLREEPMFTRSTTSGMMRLELLGAAKEKNGRWTCRNPLIRRALYDCIDQVSSSSHTNAPVNVRNIYASSYIEGSAFTDGGDFIGRDKITEQPALESEIYRQIKNLLASLRNEQKRDDALKTINLIESENIFGKMIDENRLGRRLVFLATLCQHEWRLVEKMFVDMPGEEGEIFRRVLKNLALPS